MAFSRSILCVVTCLCLAGCGGGSDIKPIANLVACAGTVTFDGKPLNHGTVFFTPEGNAEQPATGTIKQGSFKMLTTVSAPGVVAGKYKVTVESVEPVVLKPGEMPPTNESGEQPPPPPSLIPRKYSEIANSGFEVEVKKGMAPVTLDLKKE